tara:strand:- start:103 stop:1236 length:1134 start_codon:yes stop_codon:yes gene_type:complete
MNYWWVNHKQTHNEEIEGGYIWSPQKNNDGSTNQTYLNLTKVLPSDIVFSYANGEIKAIGTAVEKYSNKNRPTEFGDTGEQWGNEGWLVQISWILLETPFSPKVNISRIAPLLPEKYSPIQQNGNGNQGCYLANISHNLGYLLIDIASASDHQIHNLFGNKLTSVEDSDKKSTWTNDIISAFENLGGIAPYNKLYDEVKSLRRGSLPESWKAIIRREVEIHSSDSEAFSGKDLFYSVSGIGKGVWGVRGKERHTPKAADVNEVSEPSRSKVEVYRILRDTALARDLKVMHGFSCQICGQSIDLSNGKLYAEAHHLKPLGSPHNGPDVAGNIVVLCPNHHTQCDYGAIRLSASNLHSHADHLIDEEYISYHNDKIFES